MTTYEILQRVIANHNRIAQVTVNGDNAILIGDAIRDLRALGMELQADLEAEELEAQAKGEEAEQ